MPGIRGYLAAVSGFSISLASILLGTRFYRLDTVDN